MNKLKNILLVTNNTSEEEIALIKSSMVKQQDPSIHLNLVHVIPNLPTCYFNIPSTVLLAERYYEEAEQCLSSIGQLLKIEKNRQWLVTGRIKTEVFRLANKLDAQFILASSNNISELRKSVFLRKIPTTAAVKTINNLICL